MSGKQGILTINSTEGILIHPISDMDAPEKNWHIDNWIELVSMIEAGFPGVPIACVGNRDKTMHIPDTLDVRGVPEMFFDGMAKNARVLISPLLEKLARKCPILTWSSDTGKDVVELTWRNVTDFGYSPPPEFIFKHLCMLWGNLYGQPNAQL